MFIHNFLQKSLQSRGKLMYNVVLRLGVYEDA